MTRHWTLTDNLSVTALLTKQKQRKIGNLMICILRSQPSAFAAERSQSAARSHVTLDCEQSFKSAALRLLCSAADF